MTLIDKPAVGAKPPVQPTESVPLVKDLFPPISGKEYDALKADIQAHGVHNPIVVYQGKILDGCNRDNACRELGVDPPTRLLDHGVDPLGYVVSANLHRRHLDESQRGMLAAKLANMKRGDNQHSGAEVRSIGATSKLLNVGTRTATRCNTVLTRGVPKLTKMVTDGKLPASVAEKVANLDPVKQAELVEQPVAKIKEAVTVKKTAATTSVVTPTSTANSDNLDKLKDAYIKALTKLDTAAQEAAAADMVKSLTALQLLK
jgi:hypothetical protein